MYEDIPKEERIKRYMSLEKEELAEMLYQANRMLSWFSADWPKAVPTSEGIDVYLKPLP